MVLCFNNYFVRLEKSMDGTYKMTILKVTGPARFDREEIACTQINSLDSLQQYITEYIPQSHLPSGI